MILITMVSSVPTIEKIAFKSKRSVHIIDGIHLRYLCMRKPKKDLHLALIVQILPIGRFPYKFGMVISLIILLIKFPLSVRLFLCLEAVLLEEKDQFSPP